MNYKNNGMKIFSNNNKNQIYRIEWLKCEKFFTFNRQLPVNVKTFRSHLCVHILDVSHSKPLKCERTNVKSFHIYRHCRLSVETFHMNHFSIRELCKPQAFQAPGARCGINVLKKLKVFFSVIEI